MSVRKPVAFVLTVLLVVVKLMSSIHPALPCMQSSRLFRSQTLIVTDLQSLKCLFFTKKIVECSLFSTDLGIR